MCCEFSSSQLEVFGNVFCAYQPEYFVLYILCKLLSFFKVHRQDKYISFKDFVACLDYMVILPLKMTCTSGRTLVFESNHFDLMELGVDMACNYIREEACSAGT